MTSSCQSERDIIIRTPSWEVAVQFYQSVLGFPVVHRDKTLFNVRRSRGDGGHQS
jgi:catechol 2,3-dioxygenase-like lactoylglutathione lyase family enzyme